jgi:hypothetical protein
MVWQIGTPTFGDKVVAGTRDFYPLRKVQATSGFQAASYSGVPGFFPEGHADGHEFYHSPPSAAEVTNDSSCNSAHPA